MDNPLTDIKCVTLLGHNSERIGITIKTIINCLYKTL